ncbi:hypothetical protein D0Y65_027668 [Glycine soja]|uniref:Uncharacterized protein n=1 Tax=Glycine soja TaxID=3848 RepID=A0A445IQP6_GLYSO|nr:hypothetical protein D0Y65_027668 [Glycine soja]
MGCGSSLPDRGSRQLGRPNSENGGGQDAKNLRVKLNPMLNLKEDIRTRSRSHQIAIFYVKDVHSNSC